MTRKHFSEEGQSVRFIDASITASIRNQIDNPSKRPEVVKKILIKRGSYKGNKNPNWNGGISYRKDGYIEIKKPRHPFANYKNYVMEHRLVMEKHLGRYLTLEEKVHHLDFNRSNNKLSNLYLFQNETKHQEYHQFLKRLVREMIGGYCS